MHITPNLPESTLTFCMNSNSVWGDLLNESVNVLWFTVWFRQSSFNIVLTITLLQATQFVLDYLNCMEAEQTQPVHKKCRLKHRVIWYFFTQVLLFEFFTVTDITWMFATYSHIVVKQQPHLRFLRESKVFLRERKYSVKTTRNNIMPHAVMLQYEKLLLNFYRCYRCGLRKLRRRHSVA